MSCAACATRVNKTLQKVAGVTESQVNYASAMAYVTFDTQLCSAQVLQQAVRDAGYDLLIETDREKAMTQADEIRRRQYEKLKQRAILAMAFAVIIMIAGHWTQCMEATPSAHIEHGYSGGHQHLGSLPFQSFQPAFPRILAAARH